MRKLNKEIEELRIIYKNREYRRPKDVVKGHNLGN